MSNKHLPTRGIPKTDVIEQRSRLVLQSKLSLTEALFTFYPDKTPNLDGHIEFFEANGSTSTAVKLFFQLKGTDQDANYHDCEVQFLNYCYKASEPTFLILVNLQRDKVYCEHVDQAYISSVLGIKDIIRFSQKTKRITFSERNVIDQNASILIDICKKHYRTAKMRFPVDVQLTPKENILLEFPPSIGGKGAKAFATVKAQFESGTTTLIEKMLLYHAFVYMLTPFYLDSRGEQKRRKLLSYIGVTDTEERFIIENLMNSGLLGRTGDLIYVIDKQDALSIFNYYLDINKVDLQEVTNTFSKYD